MLYLFLGITLFCKKTACIELPQRLVASNKIKLSYYFNKNAQVVRQQATCGYLATSSLVSEILVIYYLGFDRVNFTFFKHECLANFLNSLSLFFSEQKISIDDLKRQVILITLI